MFINAYDHNGSNWEYCGLSWQADRFSMDGDFSAFADGERILLVAMHDEAYADEGEDAIIARREGVVRGGKFCDA